MNVWFETCSDAIACATESAGYGIFYSNTQLADRNIHTHDCCEVLFCLSGGQNFLIDDKIYEVNDGDVFIINQFEPHKITFKTDVVFERFTLQVHPSFLYKHSSEHSDLSGCFYVRGNNISNKVSPSGEEIKKLTDLFLQFNTEDEFADDIIKNFKAVILLAYLNHIFFKKEDVFVCAPPKINNAVVKSVQFINENLSSDLTLELIAKHSYISINQLCGLFKKHLGTTVIKYIVSRRINEAKKMLKSGKSVSETAFACGFKDYANFIRTFKSIVGVSPGKYANK